MTKLAILSANERLKFDSPPRFDADERTLYFSLTKTELNLVQELRTTTNKVGFILQLGYFKVNGKFYTTEQFRQQDVNYVIKMLGFEPAAIDLSSYQKKIPTDHRKKILSLLEWQAFNKLVGEKINEHIKWLVRRQLSLRAIFLSIIDFCWQNKIELPSYNFLSNLIVEKYNEYENELINTLANKLTSVQIERLNQLANIHSGKKLQKPKITLIKKINQSLSPTDIQENVEVFKMFKEYFYEFQSIIEALNLSDQATEYFAIWVQKSTTFQLNSFANKNKLYLHLLCYIRHQFYFRQDLLVDILLKSVQSVVNSANKQINQQEKKRRPERNKAITKLTTSNRDSRELIEMITEIVKSPILLAEGKLTQIEQLLDQHGSSWQ